MKQTFSPSMLAVLGAVLLVALSGFWLVPTVGRTATDLAGKQAEVAKYQEQIEKLRAAQLRLENAGLVDQGGIPLDELTLNEALPPHRDYEDLLAMIESIGAASGIVDPISISYTPVKEGAAADIAETPLTLGARGSYGAIEELLRNLQTSLRPLALTSVDLGVDEKGGVTASINALTYTREVAANTEPAPADGMSNLQTP